MNTGPFTIYYLGYPPPNTNQDTLQSWAEETSNIHTLTQTLGLLELYHIHGSEKQVEEGGIEMSTGNQVPNLGFGHLGFTVPDVPATVERLRKDGVRIVKELGSIGRETVPLSQFEAERGVGVGEISEEYARFWRQIACVADPDGYIIELLPQNMQ
ncbi:lactoylglutathione lyase Glo1 [Aspergillus sclerotialis]|uniref:Lactoylglutathione lyase Glo1 n=1 Tax=Aspergillus sclerotialis TaxID=2070753 RepID=A0A3A2ZHG8_9EURO|nr:lactoylglutathione lyase Glo1 [Aspergillus sclerotialis]